VSLMSDATSVSGTLDRRRWLVLGVIGLAQLMVVLDLTIMNIALPSAQRALHFTTVDRQWVLTAYSLAFGSLLLLGGRLADLLGRKVTFLTGLVGFAGVSAIWAPRSTSPCW
jgi:MFS family permease